MEQQTRIISELNAEYERLRREAQDRADFYYRSAMRSPAFRDAEARLKSLTVDIAREEYALKKGTGSEEKLGGLYRERDKSSAARKAALHKLGIKERDLAPSFSCKKCKDTGFVGLRPCSCYKKKLTEIVLRELKADVSLPAFTQDTAEKSPELEKIYALMKEYVRKFPDVKTKNFLFTGKTGAGKTFLAGAMTRDLLNRDYNAIFLSAFALNNLMLKAHTTLGGDRSLYLDIVSACDFLAIDDLGTEPVLRNVTVEYLLEILNERIRLGKATVVTTNLTPAEILERYNERVFSRLTDKSSSRIVSFPDDNLRAEN